MFMYFLWSAMRKGPWRRYVRTGGEEQLMVGIVLPFPLLVVTWKHSALGNCINIEKRQTVVRAYLLYKKVYMWRTGNGEKGESVHYSTFTLSIPVHQNTILPKSKTTPLPLLLYYLVRGCVLCKVLLRTKCLFSRKGQHANVFSD